MNSVFSPYRIIFCLEHFFRVVHHIFSRMFYFTDRADTPCTTIQLCIHAFHWRRGWRHAELDRGACMDPCQIRHALLHLTFISQLERRWPRILKSARDQGHSRSVFKWFANRANRHSRVRATTSKLCGARIQWKQGLANFVLEMMYWLIIGLLVVSSNFDDIAVIKLIDLFK